jgi:hypothetical protein
MQQRIRDTRDLEGWSIRAAWRSRAGTRWELLAVVQVVAGSSPVAGSSARLHENRAEQMRLRRAAAPSRASDAEGYVVDRMCCVASGTGEPLAGCARSARGTGRVGEARPDAELRLDGRSLIAEGPTPRRTSRFPGLLERVVQLRRRKAAEAEAPADDPAAGNAQRIKALEERVEGLEALLEGLQDAVDREAVRRGKQIEALEAKTEPGEVTRALSRDARKRGI